LTHPQAPDAGDTNPAISPDGKSLVFRRMRTLFNGSFYELPLGPGPAAGGEPRRLTGTVLTAQYPTWMPDSKRSSSALSGV
jgi:hypothetical protein